MKNKSIGDDYKLKNPHVNLFYRAMRITTFLLFFCSFCALADNVNSQTAKVTIKRSNVTLLDVLNEIENQTNYLFIYSNDINVKRPVSINVNAKAVNSVLAKLFAGKDVAYQMEGTHIVLTKTEKSLNEVSVQQQSKRMENITGVVLDEAGEPIIGASVKVQNTTIGTITDLEGKFKLELPAKSVIEISFIGYRTKTVVVGKEKHISIYMEEDTKALDEVIVVGYVEAMNEMEGSYTDEDGQVTVTRDVDQMVKYFNQIRYRAGQPGITTADAADQSRMRELIKHERLIEFAFESHRYWDLRRWKDAYDAYNKPIRGLDVSARESQREQFYTERIWNTEKTMKRMFSNKMYLWPLDRNVLRKNGKLVQNPGWN